MRATYDTEGNVLWVTDGSPVETCASFLRGPDAALELAQSGDKEMVGFIIVGASSYLPLGKGYDVYTDTLVVGGTATDPALAFERGDLVAYWERHPDKADWLYPIGFALRRASEHLASVLGDKGRCWTPSRAG